MLIRRNIYPMNKTYTGIYLARIGICCIMKLYVAPTSKLKGGRSRAKRHKTIPLCDIYMYVEGLKGVPTK